MLVLFGGLRTTYSSSYQDQPDQRRQRREPSRAKTSRPPVGGRVHGRSGLDDGRPLRLALVRWPPSQG